MPNSILASWPWNPNSQQNLAEMEVYTRRFSVGERAKFVVPRPMDGFSWTGLKVRYYHTNDQTSNPNAVLAQPSMIEISSNNNHLTGVLIMHPWTMLPMVMNEVHAGDELFVEIRASYGLVPAFVQVELLAQKV